MATIDADMQPTDHFVKTIGGATGAVSGWGEFYDISPEEVLTNSSVGDGAV